MAFLVLLFQGCALNQSGYYDSQGVYHVYSETSNSTTPVSTPTSTPSGGGSAYPFTAAVGATGYNATYITVKGISAAASAWGAGRSGNRGRGVTCLRIYVVNALAVVVAALVQSAALKKQY
jgi:hypothetical protein